MTKKQIIGLLVALLVGFGVGYFITYSNGATVSAAFQKAPHTEVYPWSFAQGAGFGSNNQSYFDKSGIAYLDKVIRGNKNTVLTTNNKGTGSLTLTASQICNNSVLIATNTVTSIGTYTLPTATLLAADCMFDAGKWTDVNIFNTATTTLTIAAGTGGTIGYDSTATIATGKYGILRIIFDTATSYKAFLVNITN